MKELSLTLAFVLCGPSLSEACSSHLKNLVTPAQLSEMPFLQPFPYAKSFNKKLIPATPIDFFILNIPSFPNSKVRRLSARFQDILGNRDFKLQVGFYKNSKEKRNHIVLHITVLSKKELNRPVAFVARVLRRNSKGELESHGSGAYRSFEQQKYEHIVKPILQVLYEDVYLFFKVKRDYIHSDYIGRYFWAKLGYDFKKGVFFRYMATGQTISQLEMTRENFVRYLRKNGLSIYDLEIQSELFKKTVTSVNDFKTPYDFAYAKSRWGGRVRVRPMIGHHIYGQPTLMDVGKAFMMSDLCPKPGDSFVTPPMGTLNSPESRFALDAMPKWYGVKEFP